MEWNERIISILVVAVGYLTGFLNIGGELPLPVPWLVVVVVVVVGSVLLDPAITIRSIIIIYFGIIR